MAPKNERLSIFEQLKLVRIIEVIDWLRMC
jgi:hypothetical protein